MSAWRYFITLLALFLRDLSGSIWIIWKSTKKYSNYWNLSLAINIDFHSFSPLNFSKFFIFCELFDCVVGFFELFSVEKQLYRNILWKWNKASSNNNLFEFKLHKYTFGLYTNRRCIPHSDRQLKYDFGQFNLTPGFVCKIFEQFVYLQMYNKIDRNS